ncbi:MAG: GDP-mannose 4,6-dehydratase [Oscillospiraceae bacterium]|nr:GDP-mannose 4,6-dehydratase [Oscillospiraceae bacterium]
MKALIIGVAGFVGRHLVNELIDSGWEVQGTRLPTEAANLDIPVYGLDVLDAAAIKGILKKTNPDCIFHLAAQSSVAVSWKQPSLTVDINVKGAVNLLEAVREMEKPSRVVLIGSGDEYGYVLPEELPINEETPLRPGNVYAVTKISQGKLGQVYARAYGLEIVIVRAFNHIGTGQTDTFVVPGFCKQIAEIEAKGNEGVIRVGNLEARRDFTDVRDVVRAYRLLADMGISGEVYNVGSGNAVSIGEILERLIGLSKAKIAVEQDSARMRPSDTPEIRADVTKLARCTGWKPEIVLKETLGDVLDEWRENTLWIP